MTEREGQIDPQPRAEPVRPAMPPLRDAKIVGFTSPKSNSYNLTYEVNGRKGYVNYTIAAGGSVEFKFTDPMGNSTTETYEPKRRGPGRRDPDDRQFPPRPGENPPPRGDQPQPAGSPGSSKPVAISPLNRSDLPQFVVTSSAIKPDENFPAEFTCDGAGVSPPIAWSGAPKGTRSFALSLWHIPGPGEVKSYWILYNIPAETTSLPKNAKGIGSDGYNGKNRTGYDPMCSKGPGPKKYNITVYALSAELNLSTNKPTRADLLSAIKDITLTEGTLTYTYERQKRN